MDGGLSTFSPDEDLRGFRNSLGQFATGVTVITAKGPDGPVGIVANSFASVSLDPPLVLWSPARTSSRFAIFEAAAHFAIHVLGQDQQGLCAKFAESWTAFDGLNLTENADGTPIFEACLARFECCKETAFDGGDHVILLGRVLAVSTRPGAPLLFHGGQYGGFAAG